MLAPRPHPAVRFVLALGAALVLAGWSWARKGVRVAPFQTLGLVLICAGMALGSAHAWRQALWGALGLAGIALGVIELRKI